jgi:hypothetical protein
MPSNTPSQTTSPTNPTNSPQTSPGDKTSTKQLLAALKAKARKMAIGNSGLRSEGGDAAKKGEGEGGGDGKMREVEG